jgi:ABC-type Fe3+ transport system permease subunit
LIWLLNRPDVATLSFLYDRTILAPWLAQTIRALPLAIFIVWHAFASVPSETLDSAQIDGAGSFRLMISIALPMRATAIGLAWLVSFAVALGEMAATLLVYPPGMTTLAVRIFGLLHFGVNDQVAGICLALLVATCALATAAWCAVASWDRRSDGGLYLSRRRAKWGTVRP